MLSRSGLTAANSPIHPGVVVVAQLEVRQAKADKHKAPSYDAVFIHGRQLVASVKAAVYAQPREERVSEIRMQHECTYAPPTSE